MFAARPYPRFLDWTSTVAWGNSSVTAAAEPSDQSLSTTTASTGMSALAKNDLRHSSSSSFELRLTISAETIGLAGSGIGQELSPDAALESADVQRLGLSQRLAQLLRNRLVRQNLVLFFGGLVAGIGGFVYHAIAGRVLGPATYGQVAFLIAVYSVGTGPALILVVVLARYTAMLAARSDPGVRSLMARTARLIAIPSLFFILLTALFARPFSALKPFGPLFRSLFPVFSSPLFWRLQCPRGILQGLQRFTALSLNLSLEPVIRTVVVFLLLRAGYAVSGAMAA